MELTFTIISLIFNFQYYLLTNHPEVAIFTSLASMLLLTLLIIVFDKAGPE